jgi:hypothetical protein
VALGCVGTAEKILAILAAYSAKLADPYGVD